MPAQIGYPVDDAVSYEAKTARPCAGTVSVINDARTTEQASRRPFIDTGEKR
jgi:hypothetical protein